LLAVSVALVARQRGVPCDVAVHIVSSCFPCCALTRGR
jgi:hypothetical protein